ncbi:LysR substrate-binding domain-containing protein [Celeribacter sp. ULVN23_4]
MVVLDMIRSGLGVGILPERVAEREQGVVRVGDLPPLSYPLGIVAHRELRTSARIRAVFDALVQNITL